jgi:hypothetical protein
MCLSNFFVEGECVLFHMSIAVLLPFTVFCPRLDEFVVDGNHENEENQSGLMPASLIIRGRPVHASTCSWVDVLVT